MMPNDDSAPDEAPGHSTPQNEAPETPAVQSLDAPSSDDPMGTRIVFVVVAMVIFMFVIALGFLFEVARHRPK